MVNIIGKAEITIRIRRMNGCMEISEITAQKTKVIAIDPAMAKNFLIAISLLEHSLKLKVPHTICRTIL